MGKSAEETRLIRAGVYIEMDLYDAANRAAVQRKTSFSSWAREIILKRLVQDGMISQDQLVRLATDGSGKSVASRTSST